MMLPTATPSLLEQANVALSIHCNMVSFSANCGYAWVRKGRRVVGEI